MSASSAKWWTHAAWVFAGVSIALTLAGYLLGGDGIGPRTTIPLLLAACSAALAVVASIVGIGSAARLSAPRLSGGVAALLVALAELGFFAWLVRGLAQIGPSH